MTDDSRCGWFVHHGELIRRRSVQLRRWGWQGPGSLWLILFLAAPLALVFAVSFFMRGEYGELIWSPTLQSYRRLFALAGAGWDPIYFEIFVRSLALAFATAAGCVALGWPLAFWIASLPARWKTRALTLATIPIWTNLLIRTYAWQLLLAPQGWLARGAARLGLISPGQALYPGWTAVTLGMVCDFLPFFVLPLYLSVEKLDWTLVEAAMDLGAGRWNVIRHGIFPQVRSGFLAGFILVFLPAAGQFVVPDLLGGAKTYLLGNAIQQQFGASRDWPFGAALTTVTLGVVAAGLWLYALAARADSPGAYRELE